MSLDRAAFIDGLDWLIVEGGFRGAWLSLGMGYACAELAIRLVSRGEPGATLEVLGWATGTGCAVYWSAKLRRRRRGYPARPPLGPV